MWSTKHFMINLIVHNCGAVIMKSRQRQYPIKRRKLHIFLQWENFLIQEWRILFYYFIIKDGSWVAERRYNDERSQTAFISQHSPPWFQNNQGRFSFCWCFHHNLAFSAAPQKLLEEKLKLILIHVFAMGFVNTWRHRLLTSGFLRVISTSRSKWMANNANCWCFH